MTNSHNTIAHSSDVVPPPYTPDFGLTPPTLAGRDEIIKSVKAALTRGPKSPWFVRGFVGNRGVGKTAVLNRLEDIARAAKWPVVYVQVVADEPLIGQLLRSVIEEAGSLSTKVKKSLKGIEVEVRAGLTIGVATAGVTAKRATAEVTVLSDLIRRTLQAVGEHAQRDGRGILITIDETQNWNNKKEVAAFAAALQLVIKRAQLPVAVFFAGLPSTRSVLSAAGTFFERMETTELDDLDADAAALALLQPASQLGFSYDAEALALIVERSKGYPYFIQLAGFHAWPDEPGVRRISLVAAQHGIAEAEKVLDTMYLERWEKLSPMEKAYLWVVARYGETATSTQLIKGLGRDLQQLATPRASLINKHRLLRPLGRGAVALTLPGFGEWIMQQPDVAIPKKRTNRSKH
jgi:hypothetical protein